MIYASDDGVELDVTTQASVQMSDSPSSSASQLVNLFQSGLVGIKAAFGLNYQSWATNPGSPSQASGVSYCIVGY